MKKLTIIFSLFVLLFVASGCGKESGPKLVLATSADYFPYEFIDTASGNEDIQGFDIDVANLIAEEVGFEYEIINTDFNGLLAALQSGQADFVMASMTPTPERAESVDFSHVYYGSGDMHSILSLTSSNLTTVESLYGKKVGAQLGSAQEEAAKAIEGIELLPLNKVPEMVQEVLAGRLDAIIIEQSAAKQYIENYEGLQFTPYSAEGLNGISVAFPKGSELVEDFNKAIDTLTKNGKIDALVQKWLQDEK